jgi:cytochrome c5/cytochrome c551/c552
MKRLFLSIVFAAFAAPLVLTLSHDQASAQASGKQVYSQVCSRCHDTGIMGSPKISDPSAWKSRIKKGKQTLYQSAIQGLGAMPPKGGSNLPDSEVKAAVDYMLAQVKGGGGGGKQAAAGGGGGGMPMAQQLLKAPGSGLIIIGGAAGAIKNPYEGDKAAIAQGEALFNSMGCVGCHAPEAGGGRGPPLSDLAWIYGDEPADLYLTISRGRPNGMPSYGNALTPQAIWQLAAYIKTLQLPK